MKLKSIQVNGFGKLENKNIEFDDKINLIVGSNESGKSTLMGFIKAIFYGVNRNKAGNSFSELEKYKPRKDVEFSGKAEYEIDGIKYSVSAHLRALPGNRQFPEFSLQPFHNR